MSKSSKLPRRRNPAAAALARPQYRVRVIKSKVKYNRKVISRQEYSTCRSSLYLECSSIHPETHSWRKP